MRRLLISLLLLLLVVWVGSEIAADPGYVLIARYKTTIEMPLWLAALGFVVSMVIAVALLRVIRYLLQLPRRYRLRTERIRRQRQMAVEDQHLFDLLYQRSGNSSVVLSLLPELARKSWLSCEQIGILERDCHADLIKRAIHVNAEQFALAWQQLPRNLKKEARFLSLYVEGLIRYHNSNKAESLIRKALKGQWYGPLVRAYGLLQVPHIEAQLARAEKWLRHYPDDADLLLTLGRFCKKLKLWGKARDYLRLGLQYAPGNLEIYHELGVLCEASGDSTGALRYYKQASSGLEE